MCVVAVVPSAVLIIDMHGARVPAHKHDHASGSFRLSLLSSRMISVIRSFFTIRLKERAYRAESHDAGMNTHESYVVELIAYSAIYREIVASCEYEANG
jgi:hypothetical protein